MSLSAVYFIEFEDKNQIVDCFLSILAKEISLSSLEEFKKEVNDYFEDVDMFFRNIEFKIEISEYLRETRSNFDITELVTSLSEFELKIPFNMPTKLEKIMKRDPEKFFYFKLKCDKHFEKELKESELFIDSSMFKEEKTCVPVYYLNMVNELIAPFKGRIMMRIGRLGEEEEEEEEEEESSSESD
jgi:hypothetical protein